MLQFFRLFSDFLLYQSELRFVKVGKGLLHDVITFYGHSKSYMYCYSKHKHGNFF